MFLSGDSELGKLLQDYYPRAAQNAKSAAELQFEKDKAAELDYSFYLIVQMLSGTVTLNGNYGEKRITDLHLVDTIRLVFRYLILNRHTAPFRPGKTGLFSAPL